jgi:AcrR family transcriptional regulator
MSDKSKSVNQKRRLLLDSAKKVFLEKGYDGASIEDISKNAGVTKSLVYYYFESKESILYMLMKESVENTIEELAEKKRNNIKPQTTDELFEEAVSIIEKECDVLKIAVSEIFKKNGKTDLIYDLPMAIFEEYKDVFDFTNRSKVLFILFAVKVLAFGSLKEKLKETLNMSEGEIDEIFKSNVEPIFGELTKKI